MAAAGGQCPPPPPPPPPPVQRASTVLQLGKRTSGGGNRLSNSSSSATPANPMGGMDRATIQHAAAGLRKTTNYESLRSDQPSLSDARVAGADRPLFERNWTNGSFDEPLERGQARNEIYAPSNDSGLSVSIGDHHRGANQVKSFSNLGDPYSERSQVDYLSTSPRSQQYSPYSNPQASPYSNVSEAVVSRPKSPATVSTLKWGGSQKVGALYEGVPVPFNPARPFNPVNTTKVQYTHQRGAPGVGSDEHYEIHTYNPGSRGPKSQSQFGAVIGGPGGPGAGAGAGAAGGVGGSPYGGGSPLGGGGGRPGGASTSPYDSLGGGSPYNQQGAQSPIGGGGGGLLSSAIDRIEGSGVGRPGGSPYRPSSASGAGSLLGAGPGRSVTPSQQHGGGGPTPATFQVTQHMHHQATSIRQITNGGGGKLILNPQEYIHAYATTTPALGAGQGALYARPISRGPSTHDPNGFVRELRDQGLTMSQRAANRFQSPVPGQVSTTPPASLATLYQHRSWGSRGGDFVDDLTRRMQRNMATGEGAAGEYNCAKCGEGISNDRPGCTALNQTFHLACFTCSACNKELAGGSFYALEGKPLCEADYMSTLERCDKCNKAITEKLLRASGKAYHPLCFTCTVCRTSLDGVPFTVDSANNVHCVTCFHDKFAPRCAVCSKPIVPESETERESVRVVAMDKSFHVNCYRCEDCGLQLSSKIEGHGCYPLDSHLYCKGCNTARVRALTANA